MSTTAPDTLSAKLADLYRLKAERDRTKDEASRAEREYRACESIVIEQMLESDPPLTSVRADGLGLFVIQTRNYINPQDYAAILGWAVEDGLIEAEIGDDLSPNGSYTVRFATVIERDEDTGEYTTKLVSGAFKLDASKATLAEHARQRLADDMVELPGLKTSTTRFVQIRK